jgi:hypothetical protein
VGAACRALAEELLQEVHVNVWRAAGGFDVARSRAIDSLRRTQTPTAFSSFGRYRPKAHHSLGLIAVDGSTVIDRKRLPASLLKGGTSALAVSVEPPRRFADRRPDRASCPRRQAAAVTGQCLPAARAPIAKR